MAISIDLDIRVDFAASETITSRFIACDIEHLDGEVSAITATQEAYEPQSLGTVQCDHAPFILSIVRDKLRNSKRIVLVPKSYIDIDLNFMK